MFTLLFQINAYKILSISCVSSPFSSCEPTLQIRWYTYLAFILVTKTRQTNPLWVQKSSSGRMSKHFLLGAHLIVWRSLPPLISRNPFGNDSSQSELYVLTRGRTDHNKDWLIYWLGSRLSPKIQFHPLPQHFQSSHKW